MASKEALERIEMFRMVGELEGQQADLRVTRALFETLHACQTEPEDVSYQVVDANGVEAMWCIPADSDPEKVLLHSHAGGTLVLSMHSDRKLAGHIAKAAGARALVVNFRRSPENPYPAQVEDVETCYRWLLEQGHRPENIASIGHSIGGYLSTNLVISLRDRGEPLPAAVLAVSPWFDMALTVETMITHDETDVIVSKEQLGRMRDAWLGGTGMTAESPTVNLTSADLSGLPPMDIWYGSGEVLSGDAVAFAERAQAAGVEVAVHSIPEMPHSFVLMAGGAPEVNQAVEEMGAWLRTKLGTAA